MSTEFRFGKRNKILGINAGDGRRIWRLYLMPPNSALEEWLKRYLLHSFYYRKTSYQTNIFCRDTCTFVSIGRVNKFKFRILGPRAAPCWDVASPQSWPRPGFSALPLTVPHARGGALQHIGVPRTSSASSPVWPPPPQPPARGALATSSPAGRGPGARPVRTLAVGSALFGPENQGPGRPELDPHGGEPQSADRPMAWVSWTRGWDLWQWPLGAFKVWGSGQGPDSARPKAVLSG